MCSLRIVVSGAPGYYVAVKNSSSLVGRFALAALVGFALFALPQCAAQDKASSQSVNGATLFRQYCASCHGVDGKGRGPAAAALKVAVPDLSTMTRRFSGAFPRARVRSVIEGTEGPVAHGSREMPVWGPVFHHVDDDRDLGNVRVDNLAGYIQSIQAK